LDILSNESLPQTALRNRDRPRPTDLSSWLHLSLGNPDNGLAKVLSLQQADEPLGCPIDAVGDAEAGAEATVGEAGLELGLLALRVCVGIAGVALNEALDQQALAEDLCRVLGAVCLPFCGVVVGYLLLY